MVGAEWSLFEDGILATCGWDNLVYAWHRESHPVPAHVLGGGGGGSGPAGAAADT